MTAQDTHSQAARDSRFQICQETIARRLNDPKTGAIILIGQHLRGDDLIGRLKQTGTGRC